MTTDPALLARIRGGFLVSVDPAVLYPAAAAFDRGVLVAASRVRIPGAWAKLDRGERCRRIARSIAEWCLGATGGAAPVAVAVEVPQIYTRRRSKGNPNDLILLALVDGGVAAYLDAETIGLLPGEWSLIPKTKKGNPWLSPRGRVIRSRITAAEHAAIVPSHDAIDAAGVGLSVLGRLERTLPGTT